MQSWVYKEGEARGKAIGKAEGREEGREEGKAEGEAIALLRILRARGISVPDQVRDRILACTDTTQIETWLDRALVAGSVEDVLSLRDEGS